MIVLAAWQMGTYYWWDYFQSAHPYQIAIEVWCTNQRMGSMNSNRNISVTKQCIILFSSIVLLALVPACSRKINSPQDLTGTDPYPTISPETPSATVVQIHTSTVEKRSTETPHPVQLHRPKQPHLHRLFAVNILFEYFLLNCFHY